MNCVTIFSCTNRPESNTLKVSRIYERILKKLDCEIRLFDFQLLPHDIAHAEVFGRRTEAYAKTVSDYVSGQDRFVFIVPEYNGSFPGILKTFLDSMHPHEWAGKKVCLVGVSDGRAGNLRGLEHLTGILQYLKMHVYHNRLPISVVNKVIDDNGNFSPAQMNVCIAQMQDFLAF